MSKSPIWTEQETQRLREQWPRYTLADFPGRSDKAIQIHASRQRIATPHVTRQQRWTAESDAFITANIDKPWGWVALKLGRTVVSVRSRCARLRSIKKKHARLNGASDADILALHSQGLSNHKIAFRLGISTECVRKNLRRLNLESRERDMQTANIVRRDTMQKTYGVDNIAQQRQKENADYCLSLGWPLTSPTEARILDLVFEMPLVTEQFISRAFGLVKVDNHLKSLCEQGLLLQSPRLPRSCVYALSPTAVRLKSEFLLRNNHEQERSVDQNRQPTSRTAATAGARKALG